jgi:hypothetical protein
MTAEYPTAKVLVMTNSTEKIVENKKRTGSIVSSPTFFLFFIPFMSLFCSLLSPFSTKLHIYPSDGTTSNIAV